MHLLQHAFQLSQHLPIVKPQHPQPELIQRPITLCVALCRVRFEMLSAIDFDDESYRRSVEVDDEFAERLLAVKVDAFDLLAAQPLP